MELTNEQWNRIEPIISESLPEKDPRGRKPRDAREVLNGILWILRTGAPWKDMPERYPPYQTCHRRFQQWIREGRLVEVLRLLARQLHERGRLNLDEAFVDATFASAKKGASLSVPPSAARAPRSSLSPLAMVFLSPYLSKALRLPSVGLWKLFWPDASSTNCLSGSSATKPTTRMGSTNR